MESARVKFPGFKNPFSSNERRTSHISEAYKVGVAVRRNPEEDELFKAYIPNFLYKPPYGMPRRVNLPRLKSLSKNPYIFSVLKTLADEAVSVGWDIKTKEEFNDDGQDYSEKIKEIKKFLRNPNGNEQSFEHLLRKIIFDILELDAGVIVKVFNRKGELKQLLSRDGGTFLINPDIYGYIGDRADFVMPLSDEYTGITIDYGGTPTETMQQIMKQYNILYRERAAYYQYGWTAGSLPVPFGKREIIYIMQNPRGDSIYGRSAVEILSDIIMNLIYGAQYYLDFYMNSNMPEGVISLLGAQHEQIRQFQENWEQQFRFTDTLGAKRKRFFVMPITNQKVDFTQFAINPKDMDVLTQQDWFVKIVWMCFGVTASEMGFTEHVNKSTDEQQIKLSKRKALRPLLQVIAYHLNTQLIPEFFPTGKKQGEILNYADVPVELVFKEEDLEEEAKQLAIYEQKIRMGVMTPLMAAKKLGINVEELEQELEKMKELAPPPIMQEKEEGFSQEFKPELFSLKGLTKWRYKEALSLAIKMYNTFDKPAIYHEGFILWNNIEPYQEVWIRDESIPHNFPKPHSDFVYSSLKIEIPPDLLDDFAKVTGSIIYDGLKKEVIARCHTMLANAISLGFVQDVLQGKAKLTKEEYANRIANNVVPDWFVDHLHELPSSSPTEEKAFFDQQPKLQKEEKPENPLKEMDKFIDEIGQGLLDLVDKIPEEQLGNGTRIS